MRSSIPHENGFSGGIESATYKDMRQVRTLKMKGTANTPLGTDWGGTFLARTIEFHRLKRVVADGSLQSLFNVILPLAAPAVREEDRLKSASMIKILVIGSVLSAAGHAGIASAHEQGGSLGDSATAADIYKVTCSDDGNGPPAYLEFQVQDLGPWAEPTVRIMVKKGRKKVSSADPVDNDGQYSPLKRVRRGGGVYTMSIRKNAAGAEIYSATFHCKTAGDVHTGTTWIQIRQE